MRLITICHHQVDEKKEEEKKEVEKKEEPLFEHLSNPARIVKSQLRVVQLEDGEDFYFL